VEVIYDITPDGRFKARAFNESNTRSSTIGSINAYTQGAGIFYTTDFETWNELYRKLLGRKPKPVVPVDEADESP
jgi:N-acetylmuramoyl-L-alanine amidase CwlA